MTHAYKILICALVAALPLLMAPSGGFPSRPKFLNVTVTGQATATNGEKLTLRSRDAIGDNWIQFRHLNNSAQGYIGFGNAADDLLSIVNESGGAIQFSGPGSVRVGGTSDTATTNLSYVSFRNLSGTEIGWVGEASAASSDIQLTNAQANGNVNVVSNGTGQVQANGVPVATVVTGSFTITLTGCTANPSAGAEYYIVSGVGLSNSSVVTLMIPSMSCTSNATTATLTGLPAAIQPSAQGGIQTCAPIRNNTAGVNGDLQLQIGSPTLITLGAVCGAGGGGFTAAGAKGTNGGGPTIITYPLT